MCTEQCSIIVTVKLVSDSRDTCAYGLTAILEAFPVELSFLAPHGQFGWTLARLELVSSLQVDEPTLRGLLNVV